MREVFRGHSVELGTSLDGPEAINDTQRGSGSFRRTMAGIEPARRHALNPACICTFTARSARRASEVLDFLAAERLSRSIHAAVLPIGPIKGTDDWSLPPDRFADLLELLLDKYLRQADRVRVSSFDAICRGVAAGQTGLCTFDDCRGRHFAVGPDGDVYPCQRFVGRHRFRLGNVHDPRLQEGLVASPAWRALARWQEQIDGRECRACPYLGICRGGCPYHALTAHRNRRLRGRDPYCVAYRRIFARIIDLALTEVFSPGNLEAVVSRPDPSGTLLQEGRLLGLMRPSRNSRDVYRPTASPAGATHAWGTVRKTSRGRETKSSTVA
jgi:uncharacterized protein